MNEISSLTEFLEAIGYHLDFFDMGRRVELIPRDEFVQFEQTHIAYPMPLQQQAWVGLLLSDPANQNTEHLIWFIRFPLDELGKLVLGARDEFLHRLVESAELHQQSGKDRANLEKGLQENPYVFRPRPERMAIFHAKVTRLLGQAPSRYYGHALDYFTGKLGWEQWSFLGYQGIADVAVRHAMDRDHPILASAIPLLPPPSLEALCQCLENQEISEKLSAALMNRADQMLTDSVPDPRLLSVCIRGLALSPMHAAKQAFIQQLLSHEVARQGDILAAISGRSWELLLNEEIRDRFLECLAVNGQGQDLFNSLLSDLLLLPETRSLMLGSLRNQARSKQLDLAIGNFFSQLRRH